MVKTFSLGLILLLPISHLGLQDAEPKADREERLREAVFRYQIRQCAPKNPEAMYFLSDGGEDPSDEFMGFFKETERPVKKQSEMGVSESNNEFIEKASGKPAVQLRIDRIKNDGEDKAEVEGSCGYATWSAKGYKYSVALEDGRWVVKSDEMTWVL